MFVTLGRQSSLTPDTQQMVKNHIEMHISEEHSQMLTCDECDHTAKNANNMEQHKVD